MKQLKVVLYCARRPGERFSVASLGLGYIASYLIQSGVSPNNVRIVDSVEEAIQFFQSNGFEVLESWDQDQRYGMFHMKRTKE